MISLMTFIHVVACVLIIAVVLIQAGRSGGLAAGFSTMESVFGAKTNETLIKATTIFATIFLITSLTLAFLSSKKEKSLLSASAMKKARAAQTAPVMPATTGTTEAVPAVPVVDGTPAAVTVGEETKAATEAVKQVESTTKPVAIPEQPAK